MSDQDRYVLEQIIEQEHKKNIPSIPTDKYFEIFSAEQILKERAFDLDPDQISSGIVGGSGDAGVDAFYIFVNRMLVREDTDLAIFKNQQVAIELIVIQSKNSGGFKEVVIKNLLDFTDNCLRLNADLKSPPATKLYNSAILEAVGKFHSIYKPALTLHPTLSIRYCYASLGEKIDPKVQLRADLLLAKCKEYYSTADCKRLSYRSVHLHELRRGHLSH